MKVKAVRLRNFRGFHDAKIELRPLTILLGPNSAGKSSFGHALAALSHAHRIFSGTPQATLTPTAKDARSWPVDLGNLADLRTQGGEGPVCIELETESSSVKLGFGLESVTGLLPSYFEFPKGNETVGNEVKRQDLENLAGQPVAISATQTDGGNQAVTSGGAKNESYEVKRINQGQWQEGGTESIVTLDGLILRAVTHKGGTSRLLSGSAQDDIRVLFENMAYLRATRARPSRTYQQEVGTPQEIGYSGECIATILHKRRNQSVFYAKLPDVPSPTDELRARTFATAFEVQSSLLEAVQMWLGRLGLASSLRSELSERDAKGLEILVNVLNQKAHNITEIGFGVSQVLPVIAAGLLQPKDSLFIVDLPEAHLHPRPQAELADFFCSLAMSGRHCLVETHSEMLFKRLRLRAEMDEDLNRNTIAYFIDQPRNGECQPPHPVDLTGDAPTRWPEGFMREGWELDTQLSIAKRAKQAP